MKVFSDESDRRLIKTELTANMIVEAAAGTGKTTELVNRMVAILAEGLTTVDRMVAVTFTEKAAGELKLRIRIALESERRTAAGTRLAGLEHALAHLEEAQVNTIHGFCSDLIGERPIEAGVDPDFETMTEPESASLYDDVFSRWFQQKLQDPPEGFRRSLRRTSTYSRNEEGPAERLKRAGWELVGWRDFRHPWKREPFDRIESLDHLMVQVGQFAELTAQCSNPARDGLYKSTERARQLVADAGQTEPLKGRDYDGLEAALVNMARDRDFGKYKGSSQNYGKGITRQQVQGALLTLTAGLEKLARSADADLAALLQSELFETVDWYEALKKRLGRLDFVDLLLKARDMIRDRVEVRKAFQDRFTHIFVDEFQDTDPLQAEILLLLAADNPYVLAWRDVRPVAGKLFIVGDPKQSIYRFRRADVGIYREIVDQLERRGALRVFLTTSFRATPSIQNAINAAFGRAMQDDDPEAYQAPYAALAPYRSDHEGQPAVIALPAPRPYGQKGITQTAVGECLPDAVASFVEWLLNESGWRVTEKDQPDPIPISARHICLLFRRFDSFYAGDITRGYVQALECRGIPHLLVGGKSFHIRREVEAIRTALSAIEWPDDELSIFAALRGPLLAIPDDALFEYRSRFKRLHPFQIPPGDQLTSALAPIAEALDLLRRLHIGRNARPVVETISLLLAETRAHAGFVLQESGEQALANVQHIAELARALEPSALSFRGIVERLRQDAGAAQAAEAPILEEASDGVRLMTVHKAKGLEFPVVILADITAKLSRAVADRYLDPASDLCALRIAGWSPLDLLEHQEIEARRDEAEGVRIAYVAATRARDLLVIPAVGDSPQAGWWLDPLQSAIQPGPDEQRRSLVAPGCPEFGNDTVLDRPDWAMRDTSVRPGLHVFDEGEATYTVVWWDPAILKLERPPAAGLRRSDLISKDADPEMVRQDMAAHNRWAADRSRAVARGSRRSVEFQTATARAADQASGAIGYPQRLAEPVTRVVQQDRDEDRPAGRRFGTLVHGILAVIPLSAGRDQVSKHAEVQGRILGAPSEEVGAATGAVMTALAHPLLERARAARALRRETPVSILESDGVLIEGVIDLAFEDDDGWTVIDYKTDPDPEKNADVYETQVSLYARAIAAATGKVAQGVILWI